MGQFIILAVIFSAFISVISDKSSPTRSSQTTYTKSLEKPEKINSPPNWESPHYWELVLGMLVQDSLHDPSSFEHVSTKVFKLDEKHLSIVMDFRAKNAFGALRLQSVRVKADRKTGKPLQIEYE